MGHRCCNDILCIYIYIIYLYLESSRCAEPESGIRPISDVTVGSSGCFGFQCSQLES